MITKILKLKLGIVTLALSVGDADNNGCIDIGLGVRIVGLFEVNLPPLNLDAKLASDAIEAFGVLGKALTPAAKK